MLGRSSQDALHKRLTSFNRWRLAPSRPEEGWQNDIASELRLRLLEGEFVERERAAIVEDASCAPRDPEGFVTWFERLRETGPGQNDPLFAWLAEDATIDQMKWFLAQEVAGEAGFDDLVALTQVKLPTRAKLELARNYWDELGQGHESGMHGPMLGNLATALELPEREDAIVWESLALGNLMVALATNRRYAFHSIGALGAIELTAPGRSEQVNAALKRLGLSGDARRYFALHATLDVKHSEAWNREVIGPLVSADPEAAQAIAEGALLRLTAGERCFQRYRREFNVHAS